AEDGIRDYKVTGVQTCALPISPGFKRGRAAVVPDEPSRGSGSRPRAVRDLAGERDWRHPGERGAEGRRQRVQWIRQHVLCQQEQIGRASCREREKKRRGASARK